MKNSLLALALLTLFVMGCGLDRLTSRSNTNTAPVATSNTATAPTSSLPARSDVDFARDALTRLVNGDETVVNMIDWENLKVMGMDAGAQYRLMTVEAAKNGFRTGFIREFSRSFKQTGADINTVTQWREHSRSGDTTIVAGGNATGNDLLITITHPGGAQKLAAIDTEK